MTITRERIRENKKMTFAIFALAWPSIVEQALQTIVQYADSAMVGRIGPQASAAVGLTTTVTWLINSPLSAMGIGALAYISASIGAKKYDRAKIAAIQSIIITIILGVVIGIITLSVSPFLPKWLGASKDIQKNASIYFGIICAPMIFRASSVIFGAVLRATGDMKTPMVVNLFMNLINIFLNFFLIYPTRTVYMGNHSLKIFGAGLGITGSGIATASAYTVSGILMFIALYRNKIVSPKGEKIKLNKPVMYKCIKVGFPVSLERITTSLGQVFFTSLVTSLGTIAFAAHSIALTAEQAFYIPGYGMQAAAATLAGNAVGERNTGKLHKTAVTIIIMAVAVMTITGGILFLFPKVMMSIFTQNQAVINYGASALKIVAISEPMFGALIILEGIFNGIGDTKTPFFFSLFSMWGIRITSTFICVKVFALGLNAVWLCMVADNVSRFVLLLTRFYFGRWKKKLDFINEK